MKKIMIIVVCWALTLAVFAQDTTSSKKATGTNEINTIFGKGSASCKIPLGYFIELNAGYSQFGHENVFLPGLSMGMILNHNWAIGITGSFIGNMHGIKYENIYYDSLSYSMRSADLHGGYGGMLIEYTLFPKSRVHVAFPVMIGGGYLYYTQPPPLQNNSSGNYDDWHHQNSIAHDYIFVVEPGVKLEFNVIKKLRVALGVSYRYSPDLDLKNTPSDLINQFTAKLSIRFGKF